MNAQTATASLEPHRPSNIISLLGRLEKSGLRRETAEIFVETVIEMQEHNAASRRDLKETEARLELKIAEVHQKIAEVHASSRHDLKETEARLELKIAEVHQKIAETKSDLTGLMLITTGVTITVLGSFIAILGFFLNIPVPTP